MAQKATISEPKVNSTWNRLEEFVREHVQIGIHTGPVVVGEIGEGVRTERLALAIMKWGFATTDENEREWG